MATKESMAIRANAALVQIETALKGLGVEVSPLPRLMNDREMLRCVQLERIAVMVNQLKSAGDDTAPVATTSQKELAQEAHDREVNQLKQYHDAKTKARK